MSDKKPYQRGGFIDADEITKRLGDMDFPSIRSEMIIPTRHKSLFENELKKDNENTLNLHGISVTYSPFLEPGTAYLVARPTRPFAPISLETEMRVDTWISERLGKISDATFAYPFIRYYENERRQGESWHDFIQRCGISVLDNLDTRRKYQAYIIRTPIRLIRRLIVWLKSKRIGESS